MLSVLTILQFADRSEDQIWQICVSHKHDEFATSSQTNMQNAESRRCVLSPPYFYVHFICSPSALVFLSFGGSLKTGQIWTISPRVCPLILILFMALTAHPHRSMHSKFACTGFIQSEWTYSSIQGGGPSSRLGRGSRKSGPPLLLGDWLDCSCTESIVL